jgi:tetratricopeptide (TPR) repeat protein
MRSKSSGFFGVLVAGAVTSAAACASNDGATTPSSAADAGPGADAADPVTAAVNAGRPQSVRVCYTSTSQAHPARAAFWAAMRANDTAKRVAVIADLEAAATALPNEEEIALLNGLAHLWRLAEPLESEKSDVGVTVQSAQRAQAELERAYALCPTDHRIPAWLGPVLINGGRAMGNAQLVADGFAILQRGIDHYPAFVLFSKLLAYANEPTSSADFQKSLEAVNANIDYCTSSPNDPACTNTFQAAHNFEGSMVFLGDVYAKAQRKTEALRFYSQAKTVNTYAAWPWKSLIEDRITTIDARVAAYATPAASDDHPAAWNAAWQCSVCHQQ